MLIGLTCASCLALDSVSLISVWFGRVVVESRGDCIRHIESVHVLVLCRRNSGSFKYVRNIWPDMSSMVVEMRWYSQKSVAVLVFMNKV